MIKDESWMTDKESKPQDIGDRSFQFVLLVLRFLKQVPQNKINDVLTKQLIRSVTSIGANIEEARGGHTKNDFAHSMNIAKKEALETRYWIKLIQETNKEVQTKNILEENNQIIKILMSIVKTASPRKFS